MRSNFSLLVCMSPLIMKLNDVIWPFNRRKECEKTAMSSTSSYRFDAMCNCIYIRCKFHSLKIKTTQFTASSVLHQHGGTCVCLFFFSARLRSVRYMLFLSSLACRTFVMLFQHESCRLTISVSFAVLIHAHTSHFAHAIPSFRFDDHFVCARF